MPSVMARPRRFALPFHVKPYARPVKRATSRSRTTRRPREDWKTSMSASRSTWRLKSMRTRERAGRAATAAKPEVAAQARAVPADRDLAGPVAGGQRGQLVGRQVRRVDLDGLRPRRALVVGDPEVDVERPLAAVERAGGQRVDRAVDAHGDVAEDV